MRERRAWHTGPVKLPSLSLVWLAATLGCGVVVVRPAEPSSEPAPAAPAPADEESARAAKPPPQIDVRDLEPRVAAAKATLASDPAGAAKELAAVRTEIMTRFEALERTQPKPDDPRRMRPNDPFYSDSLSPGAKSLLASTSSLRAGLWADQGKVEDALRELLVVTPTDHGITPCPDGDASCPRARDVIAKKYKGFCWDFASSECTPRLDDDAVAFDKAKPTLFSRAEVKKVVARGQGVDVLTGDVLATDIEECKGKFETDKILDVDARRILVERTTWCKSLEKHRRAGWRITHHLGKVPLKIAAGDRLLLLTDATKIRRAKSGDTIVVDADSVLLAVRSMTGKPKYRWNEVTP